MRKIALASLLLMATGALAQSTPATGDSRTVTEPSIPTAICAQVQATKYIVQTNAVNIDPFNPTCGSTGGTNGTLGCTGGTDYQPSSTSGSYTAAETTDNTAVQNAINSCTSGQAVELVPGSSGQLGFVLSPWHLASHVSIIIDAGIRVFASRQLSDYGGTNCGVVTGGSSSCSPWITAPSASSSGIYGYGTLDGRGWDALIGQTFSFYSNRIQSKCNNNGGPAHGWPNCTPNGAGSNSFGPDAVFLSSTSGFTMYKVTVTDSGDFLVNLSGGSAYTGWDIKLISPFEVQNTDAWDPQNFTNATLTHSWISSGDNLMAVKASSSATSGISYTFNQTSAGIAATVGTAQNAGVSNVLVDHLQQNGNLNNDLSGGIMLASSTQNGGNVDRVTFSNICMVNETNSIRFYTNYGCNTGSDTPNWTNILLQQVAVLANGSGNSGKFTFQGLSGNPINVQFNGFTIAGTNQGIAQQCSITKDQYTNYYQGPGAVPSSVISQLVAGTSNNPSGSAGSSTPYCTASGWQPLIGELNLQSSSRNNNQTYNGAAPYTLQAVIQPVTAINSKESAALTQPITFLDNGTSVGTGSLSGDGTLAQLTISTLPSPGTHVYTAKYPGDSNYPAYTFGSVTVTVSGGPSPPLLGGTVTFGNAELE